METTLIHQMSVPFESKKKDKQVLFVISPELLSAANESAKRLGLTRVAFIRAAMEEFITLSRAKRIKSFNSKYESLPQSSKLAMRLNTELYDELKKAAEANGRGLYEAFREAIERALRYS